MSSHNLPVLEIYAFTDLSIHTHTHVYTYITFPNFAVYWLFYAQKKKHTSPVILLSLGYSLCVNHILVVIFLVSLLKYKLAMMSTFNYIKSIKLV